ncbi:MAG: hypothetical protein ACI3XA_03185 [Clostridia bacterium]
MPVIAVLFLGSSLLVAKAAKNRLGNYLPLVFFLAVCILCEIFFFNFEYFRSRTYDPIEYFTVTYSSGVKAKDGSYQIRSAHDYIEISNIIGEVENIHISTNTTIHTVRFMATDDANINFYYAGERKISRFTQQTSYMKTNFTGEAKTIRITIPDISNRIVTLSDIRLNCPRPMFFNVFRILVCYLVLLFIHYFIATKDLWKVPFDADDKNQNSTTVALALVLAASFLAISSLNPGFVNPTQPHFNQYNDLADAFLKGQLHLDKEVPDVLKEMNNPYDRYERKAVFKNANMVEPWDTAYYNGKFYVYFGVLPVLLFYLPSRLLGVDFPNFLAVVIFGWVLIAGVFLLYRQLIKKYLKDVPYLLYLTLSAVTILTGGVVYIIKRPDFYSVPIIGALAFTIMGLYFWIKSIETEKINRLHMTIGSVFMASVIALRPNLIFYSCAAFIIFWDSVFKHRELLSVKSKVCDDKYRALKNTLAFCAPYIIFASFVMVYNYLRFDSPFDFGAAYNLTTSDMTQRGFALDRFGLGVFEYLFRPPRITGTFPFLSSSLPETSYIGFTSKEGMFGGIFITYPVLWVIFAMHKTKHQWPFKLSTFLIITSFFVCLVDIHAGGILPRYTSDFAVFFVMAASIVIFGLYKEYPSLATKFAAWALLCMVLYDTLLIFAGGTSTIQTMNKPLYMSLYSAFSFFL